MLADRRSTLNTNTNADFSKYTAIAPEEWLEGTVVSIMNYGAFVRLDGDVDGMVHISQLDPHGERVDSVYNAVEVRFTCSSRSVSLQVSGKLGLVCFSPRKLRVE